VQLAARDQHRAHLCQLAARAAEAIGLGIEGEELRFAQRQVQQLLHAPLIRARADGMQARLRRAGGSSPSGPPAKLASVL
jgi:hypothetical protein